MPSTTIKGSRRLPCILTSIFVVSILVGCHIPITIHKLYDTSVLGPQQVATLKVYLPLYLTSINGRVIVPRGGSSTLELQSGFMDSLSLPAQTKGASRLVLQPGPHVISVGFGESETYAVVYSTTSIVTNFEAKAGHVYEVRYWVKDSQWGIQMWDSLTNEITRKVFYSDWVIDHQGLRARDRKGHWRYLTGMPYAFAEDPLITAIDGKKHLLLLGREILDTKQIEEAFGKQWMLENKLLINHYGLAISEGSFPAVRLLPNQILELKDEDEDFVGWLLTVEGNDNDIVLLPSSVEKLYVLRDDGTAETFKTDPQWIDKLTGITRNVATRLAEKKYRNIIYAEFFFANADENTLSIRISFQGQDGKIQKLFIYTKE